MKHTILILLLLSGCASTSRMRCSYDIDGGEVCGPAAEKWPSCEVETDPYGDVCSEVW